MKDSIKVLLVDDHAVVRQGLRALLEREEDINIAGEAENGRDAIRMNLELMPDIVVMDIAMPELNGLEATRRVLRDNPSGKVIVLSSYSDDEFVHQLTGAGASGYVLKKGAVQTLIKAIREVYEGNAYFSPPIAKRLLEEYRESFLRGRRPGFQESRNGGRLTPRESEVLQLIAEGNSNKQIAGNLCLSVKTVEKHRQQVMNKLNIHDVAGLTRYALARSIIEPSPKLE